MEDHEHLRGKLAYWANRVKEDVFPDGNGGFKHITAKKGEGVQLIQIFGRSDRSLHPPSPNARFRSIHIGKRERVEERDMQEKLVPTVPPLCLNDCLA